MCYIMQKGIKTPAFSLPGNIPVCINFLLPPFCPITSHVTPASVLMEYLHLGVFKYFLTYVLFPLVITY